MECILSVCHVNKNERGTAGLIYSWLFDKNSKEKYGGLVCEIAGDYSQTELEIKLHQSIDELYTNGYSDDFNLGIPDILINSVSPHKNYGTCLVGLCFYNYIYPLIEQ